ncbi:hypothetical protein MHBO_000471 [Bonamia ostreae]|uniref:Uncharacterized protein n=1 Tax=Bonamia ostreae TaxID=126728 RepID=A0ABV2AFR0_9EUKA
MAGKIKKNVLCVFRVKKGIHLGSYLGTVKNLKYLANSNILYICIADTVSFLEKDLIFSNNAKTNFESITSTLLASGLDASNTKIFRLSKIRQIFDIAWILGCPLKIGNKNLIQLYSKLLYSAVIQAIQPTHLFIGTTQRDKLLYEETKNVLLSQIKKKEGKQELFYKEIFSTLNEPIKSLQNPENDMGEEADKTNFKGNIYLTDGDSTIVKKINRSVTDSEKGISRFSKNGEKRIAMSNLINIFAALRNEDSKNIESLLRERKNKKDFKDEISKLVIEQVSPIRKRAFSGFAKTEEFLVENEKEISFLAIKQLEILKKCNFIFLI